MFSLLTVCVSIFSRSSLSTKSFRAFAASLRSFLFISASMLFSSLSCAYDSTYLRSCAASISAFCCLFCASSSSLRCWANSFFPASRCRSYFAVDNCRASASASRSFSTQCWSLRKSSSRSKASCCRWAGWAIDAPASLLLLPLSLSIWSCNYLLLFVSVATARSFSAIMPLNSILSSLCCLHCSQSL